MLDTTLAGSRSVTTPELAPGEYRYAVLDGQADTIGAGRFDVNAATAEMRPDRVEPEAPVRSAAVTAGSAGVGRPLRTSPWPYLLVILLLCGEWIVRRRSGLR